MEHSMRLVVVIVILVAQFLFIAPGSSVDVVELSRAIEASTGEIHLQPIGVTEYHRMLDQADIDHAGRQLAPFQLCLPCKCCATNADADTMTTNNRYCVTVPCCYGIDCHLPDKPFGVCAFVPKTKTCNCTSCAAAT